MKQLRRVWGTLLVAALVVASLMQHAVYASPFGQGVFGADVPFGGGTSLALALGGSVTFTMTPSGNNFVGSGSHTLTVTTTDVVGYRLYIYTPSSSAMSSGYDTIPASANAVGGALALNTWGFNTDASTNYIGASTAPKLLKDANGPYKNGDNTTVKYGVYVGPTKGAGSYTVPVVYTAVAKSE